MENNFNTSVNIIRDTERDFHYIPTPNAKQVVGQIVNDFKKGIHSFNIIGTYGTGKSSFLLALEQSIKGTKRFYDPNFLPNPTCEFIKIIGSYNSIIDQLSDLLGINSSKNRNEHILSEIFNQYYAIENKNKILFIFIDEFGKFLEYATKHNPEDELYFIQQLTEFCNNHKNNIVLITTVHQSFESYAYSLSGTQKQEWIKVKGRFREVTFNEPVEQLLFLASEHVDGTKKASEFKNSIKKCLELSVLTKAFNYNIVFLEEISNKLFPLDILAANILTLALQRYGQNERSLFSFLESTDHTGIYKYEKKGNPFYNLSCVYDYLIFNYYSFLTSKYNPDFSAWSSIRYSIEEAERSFDDSIVEFEKAIKTIGLFNIFSPSGSVLSRNILSTYLETACGVKNGNIIIDELQRKQIIHYRIHSQRYILFEGTDLDIQTALIEAGNKISEVSDVTTLLNKYFQFAPVFAKLYSYEKGTPRFFEFVITEDPTDRIPVNEIDGYIYLIFNDKINATTVQEISKNQKEAILYCFFENSFTIKSLLFEIEKIKKVIEENKEDKVARRELENIITSQTNLLNHQITESIFNGSVDVKWFFNGFQKSITCKKDFNKLLSQVCNEVYYATPVFVNELVNKHKISSSIHTAKRNYFKALANNWDKENLGFEEDKFPPEKTIYLSLLKENGISPIRETALSRIEIDETSSFNNLWKVSERFLEGAKVERKKISEFSEVLGKRPFKLKQGLIDFWIPTFLFLRRDDFALFNDDGYIPGLSDDNLELIAKYPDKYTIKTFDVEGVKLDIFNSYRTFLNQSQDIKFDNNSFIETIKPFIVFYKGLPQYSKQTNRLSVEALKIRHAITNSRDPEETFFEAFPSALGTTISQLQNDKSKLQSYTLTLQNAIRELRTSYDGLVSRFEEFICTEFIGKKVEFEDYKHSLQNRYKKLKKHLLLSNQKTFIQRIDSLLEDRKAWLNSIAQAAIGKTLETFNDEDEILLYEKFKSMIFELDSLSNISKTDFNVENEEVIGVKIDTFFNAINPKVVRVPKNKTNEIDAIMVSLKQNLSSDKTNNIAAVLKLLKELLQ